MTSPTLHIIPVVHTEADLGGLADRVRSLTEASRGREAWEQRQEAVARIWDRIEAWAEDLRWTGTLRLYQDGLPICAREEDIVRDLCAQGSRNHRILVRLMERGGTLMGTESPDLLLAEYEAARRVVSGGGPAIPGGPSLLNQRDAFIAGRIGETLGPGETGVLFIGALHEVASRLDAGVTISFPLDGHD